MDQLNYQRTVMLNENFITESLGQLRKGHLPPIENAELYSENESFFHHQFIGLEFLNDFFQESEIEELIFHRYNQVQIISSRGDRVLKLETNKIAYEFLLESLLLHLNIELNARRPFITTSSVILNKFVRVSIISMNPLKRTETKIFIRFFRRQFLALEEYKFTEQLKTLIEEKKNILICGGTGSGKTTLLNSIIHSPYLLNHHHCIIEDAPELRSENPYFSNLSSQILNTSLHDLLKASLRLRPNRIFVGEIRGEEATTFISALNTGHQGCITTIHANSALDGMKRLSLLLKINGPFAKSEVATINQLCAENINAVIYMEEKKIKEIIEIKGCSQQGNIFYESSTADAAEDNEI